MMSYPPQEWREVYVVIPTIWAVDIERQSTKRNVFKIDPSRSCIETHLITTSEWCARCIYYTSLQWVLMRVPEVDNDLDGSHDTSIYLGSE